MDQQQQTQPRVVDPNKWQPGKYRARAIDWDVGKTKEGLPQIMVLFGYKQDVDGKLEDRELIWFGNFKGGARERTMETLFTLGLRQPISAMEGGRDSKALDEKKEMEIVVEHREHQGKIRAGISWVNEIGGGAIHGKLEAGETKTLFSDLDAEFMHGLQQKGVTPKGQTPAQSRMQEPTFTEEDVPF